jgi:hypothetical protein
MSWTDLLGYAASVMVLATFCMSSMVYSRLVAIGSNILFIVFGSLAHIHPVLLLHLVLLPVNLARLMQSGQVDAYHVLRRQKGEKFMTLSISKKLRTASTTTVSVMPWQHF